MPRLVALPAVALAGGAGWAEGESGTKSADEAAAVVGFGAAGQAAYDRVMGQPVEKRALVLAAIKAEQARASKPPSDPKWHNRAGRPVSCGRDDDCKSKVYCGVRKAIPGTNGQCGPSNGPQCSDCKAFIIPSTAGAAGPAVVPPVMPPAMVNDEGAPVALGRDQGSRHLYYCGRNLGPDKIDHVLTNGGCGPSNGAQCISCQRYQAQGGVMPPVMPPAMQGGAGGAGGAAQPEVMSVAVPAGVQGGGSFQVNVPGRGMMMLTVPMGLGPGQSFKFQLPPRQAQQGLPPPQQQQQLQQQQQQPLGSVNADPGLMRVTVPAGVSGGQDIRIQVPGKGLMQVTVPPGLGPGSVFQIRTS